MMVEGALLAGVELGGTKCVCTLGTGPQDIREQWRVPTGSPGQTLAAINERLDAWGRVHGKPAALGIGSFGPLDLRRSSPRYGYITSTPKPGWRDVDVLGALGAGRDLPLAIDTDVNAAAAAEGRWGAGAGLEDFAYVTIGTGIGVGLVAGGQLVHGANHGELGHIRVARVPGDTWPGVCPFHGDCVEGLASGPAIRARAGASTEQLHPEDPAWDFAAHAVGQMLHTLTLATAPRRIIIGGGVGLGREDFLERVRRHLLSSINGFVDIEQIAGPLDAYVVHPGLGEQAGPLGALALAAARARVAQ